MVKISIIDKIIDAIYTKYNKDDADGNYKNIEEETKETSSEDVQQGSRNSRQQKNGLDSSFNFAI